MPNDLRPLRRGPVLQPRVLPPATRFSIDERDRVERGLRQGELDRVRRGVHVPARDVGPEKWQRREADMLAAMRGIAERFMTQWWFSHTSAAFLWGCWVYPLREEVHTTQLYQPKIVRARDPHLRQHWTKRLLAAILADAAGRRGVKRARRVLELADARSESPGESVTRWLIHELGLPAPDLAIWVMTPLGEYWIDVGCEELKVGIEFDGEVKYGGGEYGDPRSRLIAEKRRHDALTEAGWTMIHVMAEGHRAPEVFRRRVTEAIARAARLRGGPAR